MRSGTSDYHRMMTVAKIAPAPWFLDGEPAIDLVNTIRFRSTAPLDLIATPDGFGDWLEAAGIVTGATTSEGDVSLAHRLRDALDRCFPGDGSVGAIREDVDLINELASEPIGSQLHLGDHGVYLETRDSMPARSALGRIARNAVELVAAGRHRNVRYCESVDCCMRFVDSSALSNRRWCSMTACGNREKARRLAARKAGTRTRAPQHEGSRD